jgi:ribosomal-protein-alanine N-acetyltransferase
VTVRAFPRVNLSTPRLLLRPFEASDAEAVHAVWNDEAYLRFAPVRLSTAEASLEDAGQWCSGGAEQARLDGKAVSFAGIERAGGRLVCHVALYATDWTAMVTEIHYWTAPWARGNGYAAEAAQTVARWTLTEHRFARITLKAVTANRASQRVAQSAGFHHEGTLRNAAWSRAGRGDFAVYSLIPSDLDRLSFLKTRTSIDRR